MEWQVRCRSVCSWWVIKSRFCSVRVNSVWVLIQSSQSENHFAIDNHLFGLMVFPARIGISTLRSGCRDGKWSILTPCNLEIKLSVIFPLPVTTVSNPFSSDQVIGTRCKYRKQQTKSNRKYIKESQSPIRLPSCWVEAIPKNEINSYASSGSRSTTPSAFETSSLNSFSKSLRDWNPLLLDALLIIPVMLGTSLGHTVF